MSESLRLAEVTPDSEQTTSLLEQAVANEDLFESLFARHRSSVRELVRLRMDAKLRSRVDLSDVVQETEIEAFRRFEDYLERRPMPFHLWLRKTAQERILMLHRRHISAAIRSVDRELPLPNASSVSLARQLAANVATPSEQINERELADKVRRAVAALSDTDREILLMRTYEDLSYNEIACVLDIEPATARKRNGRALIRLHQLLADDGVTESQL
ncbi:MAG: hypothetical protein CMJ78_11410 [Planctomycetaceae bacterium]|nr:hypothetical protein [Planctomycetaceae bacterium]